MLPREKEITSSMSIRANVFDFSPEQLSCIFFSRRDVQHLTGKRRDLLKFQP